MSLEVVRLASLCVATAGSNLLYNQTQQDYTAVVLIGPLCYVGVVLQQSAVWLERLKLRLFANPIIRHFVNLATVQYAFAFISKLFDTTVIIINR